MSDLMVSGISEADFVPVADNRIIRKRPTTCFRRTVTDIYSALMQDVLLCILQQNRVYNVSNFLLQF